MRRLATRLLLLIIGSEESLSGIEKLLEIERGREGICRVVEGERTAGKRVDKGTVPEVW